MDTGGKAVPRKQPQRSARFLGRVMLECDPVVRPMGQEVIFEHMYSKPLLASISVVCMTDEMKEPYPAYISACRAGPAGVCVHPVFPRARTMHA